MSVLAQTHPAFEVIVVENGASGVAKGVLEELQAKHPRLRYLYRAEASVSGARNAGISAAEAPLVALLDDDDEWLPAKLERQIELMEKNPDVALVTCDGWIVYSDGSREVVEPVPSYKGELSFKSLVSEGNCIWAGASNLLIKKECFDRIGSFNSRFDSAEDYDWYLRVSRFYRIGKVEEPLFRYHIHSDNVSKKQAGRMWGAVIAVLKALRPSRQHGVTQRDIQEILTRYAQRLYGVAADAIDQKCFRQAGQAYLGAIWGDPLIGLKIPWNRFSNPVYRTARPYFAAGYCWWRSLAESGRQGRVRHV